MKTLIKLEELAMFILSAFFISKLSIQLSWWLYILLFLSPDIGAAGYLFNTKIGAVTYNLFHHKAIAVGIYIAGILTQNEYLQLAGLLLFGHSSFDRIFGYGLKYPDYFKHTHLGVLAEKKTAIAS
ncbi:MAG TPA: DUF4260 domain-containing protein [Puia sp.]|nr:DUF4260 domain-containing protein [Puia sp.]